MKCMVQWWPLTYCETGCYLQVRFLLDLTSQKLNQLFKKVISLTFLITDLPLSLHPFQKFLKRLHLLRLIQHLNYNHILVEEQFGFRNKPSINPLMPNDDYSGRTPPLTSKRCILYIYSTNKGTEYFKHGIYSPIFFSSKCSLFHNSNIFGSCIIHILYTGVLKLKK